MSTSPEPRPERTDDELVGMLSRWLAGHVDDAELRAAIEAAPLDELESDKAAGVRELLDHLSRGAAREELQVSVREALELLAL
jgi:hypothetical protein